MSSQNNGFPAVEFSISSPFQNVRLMEVPDEVLNIITTHRSSGSKTPALKFKSASASSATSDSTRKSSTVKAKEGILHLCSDDRAWAIKQVSTSNSVYLMQPSASSTLPSSTTNKNVDNNNISHENGTTEQQDTVIDGDGDHDEMVIDTRLGSVTATSQVRNFIELHPVTINIEELETTLLDMLPLYDIDASEEDATANTTGIHQFISETHKHLYNMDSLINNIARPDQILKDICARLCVFEAQDDQQQQRQRQQQDNQILRSKRRCYIPSPSTLLKVWSNIIESCSIELIKLDHAINEERIIAALSDDNPNYKSIARAMLKPNGMFDQLGLIESTDGSMKMDPVDDNNKSDIKSVSSTRYFKPQETSKYIATLILRASAYRQILNQATLSSNSTVTAAVSAAASSTTQSNANESPFTLPISTNQFTKIWSNNLPTSFTKYTTLETLRQIPLDNISITSSSNSTHTPPFESSPPTSSTATATATATAKAKTSQIEEETNTKIEWRSRSQLKNPPNTTNIPSDFNDEVNDILDLLLSPQREMIYKHSTEYKNKSSPGGDASNAPLITSIGSTTSVPASAAASKGSTNAPSNAGNAGNATNKRKWHEKFGAQRKG